MWGVSEVVVGDQYKYHTGSPGAQINDYYPFICAWGKEGVKKSLFIFSLKKVSYDKFMYAIIVLKCLLLIYATNTKEGKAIWTKKSQVHTNVFLGSLYIDIKGIFEKNMVFKIDIEIIKHFFI